VALLERAAMAEAALVLWLVVVQQTELPTRAVEVVGLILLLLQAALVALALLLFVTQEPKKALAELLLQAAVIPTTHSQPPALTQHKEITCHILQK
jgi:hypothetical protein